MILAPSTLATIHDITGEEAMPRSRLLRRVVSLIYAVDPTMWSRSVDICLIGGDPLTLALRLAALTKSAPQGAPISIGIVHTGAFSGAPIASLSDDAVLDEFVASGALSQASALRSLKGEDRARQIVLHAVDRALGCLNVFPGTVVFAIDHVQGARDQVRGEVVLRLTRDRAARRHGALQTQPAGSGASRLVAASLGAADLFAGSERIAQTGMSRLRRGLQSFAVCPPAGSRFADILVAKRAEVLSGFISPGDNPRAIRFDESFMEREIGADLFRFSRGVPTSVEDAIASWRADLLRASEPWQKGHLVGERRCMD